MKPLMIIVASLVLFSVAGVAFSEETADLAHIGEKIRSGAIDVGNNYSMDFKTGRFHIIHADKLLLDCTNCHIGKAYKEGVLNFSKYKPFPSKAKGEYERTVCLGCHMEGGIASSLYTPASVGVELQMKKAKK